MSTISRVIFILLVLFSFNGNAQDKAAYRIFTSDGKEVSYPEMLKKLKEQQVVLFGELHNNPIAHWLELELAKDLYGQFKNRLVLGAEFFEADDQLVMNEFISGIINEQSFTTSATIWENYTTDYSPLLQFAALNKIEFIATNIPRRYASIVARNGVDSLNNIAHEAKSFMVPLPFKIPEELPSYKEIQSAAKHAHSIPFMMEAQAIKDATMAHFIGRNLKSGSIFLHFNGSYHSNNKEGIYWYLKEANPELKVMTIATIEQDEIDKLEKKYKALADYIIVTPAIMTKTF